MGTEHSRTEVTLDPDARLASGVGKLVEQVAKHSRLAAQAQKELARAAEQACRDVFPLLNGRAPRVRVVVECYADRIEISVEHAGWPLPAAALEALKASIHGVKEAETAGSRQGRLQRVVCERRNGRSQIRMIEYFS